MGTTQYVDAEPPMLLEMVKSTDLIIQTDQHQKGIKRHGGEGVDGQPIGLAVSCASGHDGDSGRIGLHDLTELFCRNRLRWRSHEKDYSIRLAQGARFMLILGKKI